MVIYGYRMIGSDRYLIWPRNWDGRSQKWWLIVAISVGKKTKVREIHIGIKIWNDIERCCWLVWEWCVFLLRESHGIPRFEGGCHRVRGCYITKMCQGFQYSSIRSYQHDGGYADWMKLLDAPWKLNHPTTTEFRFNNHWTMRGFILLTMNCLNCPLAALFGCRTLREHPVLSGHRQESTSKLQSVGMCIVSKCVVHVRKRKRGQNLFVKVKYLKKGDVTLWWTNIAMENGHL